LFIPDPDPDFLPIPDPRSRGQKGPGSGSATLDEKRGPSAKQQSNSQDTEFPLKAVAKVHHVRIRFFRVSEPHHDSIRLFFWSAFTEKRKNTCEKYHSIFVVSNSKTGQLRVNYFLYLISTEYPPPLPTNKNSYFLTQKEVQAWNHLLRGGEFHSQPLAASPAHGLDEARISSVKVAILKF
jgi:hypothetical protein